MLISVLIGLGPVLLAIALARRHRSSVLLAGTIETLHSPPMIYFNDGYWTPDRLGGGTWGIEDVLLCFSLGAGVWFAAIFAYRQQLATSIVWRTIVARLLAIALPTTALAFVFHWLGLTEMEVIVSVMLVTTVALGLLRPDLVRLSISAVLLYVPYYTAFLLVCGALLPGFFGIWSGSDLWGATFFGLPVDEIAFILAFAACYPLIVGIVLDARLRPRAEPVRP
ncbi:MAG: hypothetical protein QNJ09_17750 [Paracoccaceae bacterium]|nr:hypothetical protein [Paracoccaceae bacterium]